MRFAWVKADEKNAIRFFNENEHSIRTKFERDRDRILYSKAFRRLSGKTQIFISGYDDHARTRLIHTLEVAQIAKTIGKNLGLDLDLIEAIAIGHDIGHTPFGHAGERALNLIMNNCETLNKFGVKLKDSDKGFKHNFQGVRQVVDIESISNNYKGLNLTNYTLCGILIHSKYNAKMKCKNDLVKDKDKSTSDETICNYRSKRKKCNSEGNLLFNYYKKYIDLIKIDNSWTIEALVVKIADEIAQRHHDVEDGLIAGLIKSADLYDVFIDIFRKYMTKEDIRILEAIKNETDLELLLPLYSKLIVNFFVMNLINQSKVNIRNLIINFDIKSNEDFHHLKSQIYNKVDISKLINYDKELYELEDEFQDYLYNSILNSHKVQSMDGKAYYIIRQLFKAYLSNPQQLPDIVIQNFFNDIIKNGMFEKSEMTVGEMRTVLRKNYDQNPYDGWKALLLRNITDYIAEMTDNMAYEQYNLLYGPTKNYRL
ncbi:dGTP triphosphohydrolase [Lutispora thermophila]|uniref:dGTPase n=1 Tax=Lutispora thermophila DSM 19022 TaxID=1122184 RepID=A0A1M6BCC9_9FIRM|nr:dNTP triphosphohydrolase [Lutispora thermophila]SHI46103.1 dGTPase [Lutispora thermophila DSM 19022]